MLQMVGKEILPAIVKHTNNLCETFKNINKITKTKCDSILKDVEFLTESIENINKEKQNLKKSLEKAVAIKQFLKRAEFMRDEVLKNMKNLRKFVDQVEIMIPKNILKMPSITDILHKI